MAMQQTTARYGATIVTVDPTQGIIHAVTKAGKIQISLYSPPAIFQWPAVGEKWMVIQLNGSWYLEGRFPNSTDYQSIDAGDVVITAPTGKIHVLQDDGDGTGFVIDSSTVGGLDVGDVKLTARTNPPAGWLICDGSAYSRIEFADLFAAIGTTYGSGNGVDTFNVPRLQGQFGQTTVLIKYQ